jgi:hypothetical protein
MEKGRWTVVLKFCPVCHRIKRLGHWEKIDEEIARILKANTNWKVEWERCNDKECT